MSKTTTRTSTALKRQLQDGTDRKRVGPMDVFRLTRDKWTQGEKVEVASLAEELGVSRVTIFRWIGSRELLLGEVIWSLCKPLWQQAVEEAKGSGPDFMAEVSFNIMSLILQAGPLKVFLDQDPEYALRILTSKTSVVQTSICAEVCQLMQQQADAGHFTPPLPIDDLGYIIVRIVESFIYSDQIVGRKPNLEIGREAIRALLSSSNRQQQAAAPKKRRK